MKPRTTSCWVLRQMDTQRPQYQGTHAEIRSDRAQGIASFPHFGPRESLHAPIRTRDPRSETIPPYEDPNYFSTHCVSQQRPDNWIQYTIYGVGWSNGTWTKERFRLILGSMVMVLVPRELAQDSKFSELSNWWGPSLGRNESGALMHNPTTGWASYLRIRVYFVLVAGSCRVQESFDRSSLVLICPIWLICGL